MNKNKKREEFLIKLKDLNSLMNKCTKNNYHR